MKNTFAALGTQFVLVAVLLAGTVNAQNWTGNQFTVGGVFTVNFLDVGERYEGTSTTSDAFNDVAEKQAVIRAVQYWVDVIGADPIVVNGGGGVVVLNVGYYVGSENNLAGSNSAIVTSLGSNPGTIITNTQAILTSDGADTSTKIDGVNNADSYILFNVNQHAEYSTTPNTQFDTSAQNGKFSFEGVMLHEMAHTLGIIRLDGTSGASVTFGEDFGELASFESHFLVGDTDPVAVGDTYTWEDIKNRGVTFSGTNTKNVYGDNWVSGNTINLPVNTHTSEYQPGSTLAHPQTEYGRLNAYDDKTLRPVLSEVELALMKDLGYASFGTDPNYLHFGRSLYQTHTGTIENNTGFESWAMFGVGLHLVAGENKVVQKADLVSYGYAGTGIRIENVGNVLTIDRDVYVVAVGEEGVGVLVTEGSGTVLINRGLIGAVAETGRAVWFNDDAIKLDSTGAILAYDDATTAIYISPNVTVGEINIMDGYSITGDDYYIWGDIINDGGTTKLTFGKSPDANGEATNFGDDYFRLDHFGNITGTGNFDLETWGGTTRLGGDTLDRFRNGIIKSDSTLNVDSSGMVRFSESMTVETRGRLTGNSSSVSIDGNLNNSGNVTGFNVIQVGTNLTNSGTINTFTTLNVGGNLSNTGTISVTTPAAVNVGGGFNNSGRVDGTGKVAANGGFINNGTLSPGNSPSRQTIGTLTIDGNFTNNAAGHLEITINPSHSGDPVAGVHNDLIKVNGNATINGGIIDIVAPTNDPSVHPDPARYVGGTKYVFLDATGDLSVNNPMQIGTTSEVLLFDFLINQSANPLSLEVPPEVIIERDYIYGRYGNTINQRSIGYYIDDIGRDPNPLGDFFGVLVALDKLNSDAGIPHRAGISKAARHALEQMSGMIYGTLAQSSITNTTIVNNTLHDVLRRDTLRFNSHPFARNLWAIGHGVGGHTYFDGNARGYGQQFGGTIVGCDRFNRWLGRTGAYISYGGGQIYSDLADKSKSKELQAGLYLRKETPIGYFLVSGGLGYNDYNTSRTISFVNRRTQNYHNAFVGTVYGEFGHEFQSRYVKFQPFAGLQYVGNQQQSFTERGAQSLNLLGDITTGNSVRSLIGTRLSTELNSVRQGSLSLFGQLVWMHEFLDRTHTDFTAQFSNPGMANFRSTAKYTVRGNSPGRDWGIAGAGLNYDAGRWRVFGGYNVYLNAHQLLHTGNIGVVLGW